MHVKRPSLCLLWLFVRMKSRSRIGKAHLQLVFLPVDNDGGDLLVHEEEDGEQEGRYAGQEVDVP